MLRCLGVSSSNFAEDGPLTLDPKMQHNVEELLERRKSENKTIFMVTQLDSDEQLTLAISTTYVKNSTPNRKYMSEMPGTYFYQEKKTGRSATKRL